jgi:pyruvate/2-oxoglutarate dehydrogenase complex dihydrolipoamide acyltransferase (E2) component
MAEGMSKGKLVRWLVKCGDRVEIGQPIFELQTPEVIYEIESFDGPGIIHLTAEIDEDYEVGQEIGYIEIKDEDRIDHEMVAVRLNHTQREYIDSVRGDTDRRTWVMRKVNDLFARETQKS